MSRWSIGLVMVICLTASASGFARDEEKSSENNPRLKAALKRFPAADANKDGILTLTEAQDFQRKAAQKRRQADGAAKSAQAPEGGQRKIYKQVGDVELPLYVYQPKDHSADAKVPAIVFFFGGGWKSGSPAQFEEHCKYLAKRGMVAITVEYRVSSRHPVKVEDCVEDAKSAMRWVRSHANELGIDPQRIASGGGSAGGHLAACVALIEELNADSDDLKVSAKPNAMLLFNPAMGGFGNASGASSRTRGPIEKVTPLTFADSKQPPCVMFFGTADGLLKGAEQFQKISKQSGNDCRLVTYDGQSHGFFNYSRSGGKYFKLTVAEADKFLVELGWLAEQ